MYDKFRFKSTKFPNYQKGPNKPLKMEIKSTKSRQLLKSKPYLIGDPMITFRYMFFYKNV